MARCTSARAQQCVRSGRDPRRAAAFRRRSNTARFDCGRGSSPAGQTGRPEPAQQTQQKQTHLTHTFLVNAFTSIYAQHTGAALAEGGGALTPYAANFLPVPGDWQRRPGLKPLLPFLYSDTESFPTLEHARALMRARCISDPFSACLTTARGARSASEHPHCTRCNTQQPLALEHALFDCPHSDILRNLSCFSHLYAASSPTGARRMRTLFTHTDQSTLSALVQHCYSLWEST